MALATFVQAQLAPILAWPQTLLVPLTVSHALQLAAG
jgi:hypothetical protein